MKTTSNHWPAKAALFATAAAVIGCLTTATAQVVTYTNGDLLVGFRASGGLGADTTFVYNIGSSVGYRDNPNQGFVGDVGDQLASIYGADWFTRSDVSFGVVGVRDNTSPAFASPVDGDPSATIYASRAASDFGSSTAWGSPSAFSSSQVIGAATQIVSFTHSGSLVAGTFSFQTAAAGTGGLGAFVSTSVTNDWANYTAVNADFGLFTGGIENTFGGVEEFAYVDLYRILATATGANPAGVRGVGDYITTIGLNAAGEIYVGTSAVPEPSTYAALFGVAALTVAGFRRRHTSRKA